MDKEERKEMVNTDRERCATSYKPDVFNFRIEDNPKVESGDVSETSVGFCQTTLRHIAEKSLHIHRKESLKPHKRMITSVTDRKTREERERG